MQDRKRKNKFMGSYVSANSENYNIKVVVEGVEGRFPEGPLLPLE
jgi:hypothetical protein